MKDCRIVDTINLVARYIREDKRANICLPSIDVAWAYVGFYLCVRENL